MGLGLGDFAPADLAVQLARALRAGQGELGGVEPEHAPLQLPRRGGVAEVGPLEVAACQGHAAFGEPHEGRHHVQAGVKHLDGERRLLGRGLGHVRHQRLFECGDGHLAALRFEAVPYPIDGARFHGMALLSRRAPPL
ncbi:hypothetical protein D3C78_1608270 [compost metagenome]